MKILKRYYVLFFIIVVSIIGCTYPRHGETGFYSQRSYPIDTIGNYNLIVKIEGEEIQNTEDSCHYYTVKNGIIEIENVLDIDTINNTISKRNLIIDSVCLYTKDTVYNIMTEFVIDSSDSSNANEQAVWVLKIPESISLSCYESCVDISYWAQVSESGEILSSHHFSHKLLIDEKDDKVIWLDIAWIPNQFSSFRSFGPTGMLSYYAPESSQVLIKIYNICGQVIDTIFNEVQSRGYYSTEWKNNNLPNGIYFIQIKTGDSTVVKKHLLFK
ncbi:MAG: T9SS type A sorting domain-containing protein [candidate division Zixibacteria bacterium]|nr:T9SS type A sorting domain-containing protein [candidate division Zixibacteria bacterium]